MPLATATTPVFVYGTLRRDCPSGVWRRLLKGARFLGRAQARGALFHVGRYPALVTADRQYLDRLQWVAGELYQLPSRRLLTQLDHYEGVGPRHRRPQEYRRDKICVFPKGRTQALEAWAYLYNRSTARLARIASGDWCST